MGRARVAILTAASLLLSASAAAKDEPIDGPEPSAEAIIADLPFEGNAPQRIYLNLAPEGSQPFMMLMDTGASFSVLTPLAARALGVTVRRTKNSPYRRGTRLGRDLQFWVDTSSSDTGSATGLEYGLLGGNFLEEYVVEIDFINRRVRFLDPKKYRVPEQVNAPNEVVARMRVTARRPFMDIEMNGGKSQVILDTGAPGATIMSGQAARKLGVDVESLPPFGVFHTVKGEMPVNLYETDSFRFAGFEFAESPVMVAPRGWYNQGGSTDSVVGMDVLQQFTMRLDYPRARIWLRRERSKVTYLGVDYAATRRAGAFLYPLANGYQVMGLAPDSPAVALGLRVGDHLTQPQGYTPKPLAETMATIERGESVLVARRDARGNWIDVVLPVGSELARSEKLAEDVEQADQQRLERWERDKSTNVYVEMNGGWVLVDGYRRRLGPRDGEVWLSFEEMQALKAERAAAGED